MEILSTSISGAVAGAFVGYVSERVSTLVGFGNVASLVSADPSRSSQIDSTLGLLLQTFVIGAGTHFISVIMPSFTTIPLAMVCYSLALHATAPTESQRIISMTNMLSLSAATSSTPTTTN